AALVGAAVALGPVLVHVWPAMRGEPPTALAGAFGLVAAVPTGVIGLAAAVKPLDPHGGASAAAIAVAALYAVAATVALARGRLVRPPERRPLAGPGPGVAAGHGRRGPRRRAGARPGVRDGAARGPAGRAEPRGGGRRERRDAARSQAPHVRHGPGAGQRLPA